MSSNKKTIRVTLELGLEVEYELNGENPRNLEELLLDGIERLFDEGLVTGDKSPAEVVRWKRWVAQIGEVVDD